jgi:hypothetical protein
VEDPAADSPRGESALGPHHCRPPRVTGRASAAAASTALPPPPSPPPLRLRRAQTTRHSHFGCKGTHSRAQALTHALTHHLAGLTRAGLTLKGGRGQREQGGTRAGRTTVVVICPSGNSGAFLQTTSSSGCCAPVRCCSAAEPRLPLPLREGGQGVSTLLKTTPRREGRRVGVGESERTQTRAPPQQGHQARLLPPPQARRCS